MARDSDSPRPRGLRTRAVHGTTHLPPGAVSTPIVHSSTFTSASIDDMMHQQELGADGSFYQRSGHPTLKAVEARLADLDGAERALLFASGMAAIAAAFLAHLEPGDHIVALQQSYGGTTELLHWGAKRFGWEVAFADAREPDAIERALKPNTRIVHVESPTNPTLCIVDLARTAERTHRHGALFFVDNTFASPAGQRAIELGADLVMYSATKSIGGHSDLLAGVVVGPAKVVKPVWKARVVFGGIADPTTAWLIERSLNTLPLRVAAANANALTIATRLAANPEVVRVFYPGLAGHANHEVAARQMALGFGPVVSFELRDAAQAQAVVDGLGLISVGPSLGGVESLVTLPTLTSHRMLSPSERRESGVADGLVRLALGIEDADDLWADLESALARSRVPAAR